MSKGFKIRSSNSARGGRGTLLAYVAYLRATEALAME